MKTIPPIAMALTVLCSAICQAADAPSAPTAADSPAATKARLQEFRHTPESEARLNKWFRDAKFGAFIHFGPYSTLAGKYKDQEVKGAYAEWIQVNAGIPCKEYRSEVASRFDPQEFNAEEWVKTFKDAGMRYVVITAKHHDGFALYDSACSDYDVMDASPFQRDIVKELSEACHRNGLKFGVYYSQAKDWSDPDSTEFLKPGILKKLHPELPADRKADVDAYIDRKALPQIQELVKNYGVDLVWFDTPKGITPEQGRRFRDAVWEINPDCVINSRVPNPLPARPAWGDASLSKDGKTLYLHVMKWPKNGKLIVEGMPGKASGASFLSPKAPQGALDFAQSKTSLTLNLPAQPIDPDDTVIKVSLENGRAPKL